TPLPLHPDAGIGAGGTVRRDEGGVGRNDRVDHDVIDRAGAAVFGDVGIGDGGARVGALRTAAPDAQSAKKGAEAVDVDVAVVSPREAAGGDNAHIELVADGDAGGTGRHVEELPVRILQRAAGG